MAAKFTVEQIERMLADAFKTVVKASRETVSVRRVFDPEADLNEAQGEHCIAMEEDVEEAESQVPTTEDLTTLQGLRTVVSKVLQKTLKEVRKTAGVDISFNPKRQDEKLQAVTKLITAADFKKLKGKLLPVSHFLKKHLGVGHADYNKYKHHFQIKLKDRKLELHRVNQTLGYRRKAHGSEIVVYTNDDMPLMQDVLREVADDMYNV